MKQGIDHCGEEEMAPLSPTDRGNQRRRQRTEQGLTIKGLRNENEIIHKRDTLQVRQFVKHTLTNMEYHSIEYKTLGSGVLLGKMLLVWIVKDNKIDSYFDLG